jgi:hypothetical protein
MALEFNRSCCNQTDRAAVAGVVIVADVPGGGGLVRAAGLEPQGKGNFKKKKKTKQNTPMLFSKRNLPCTALT